MLQQFENDADVLGANYDEANSILWYYEVNDDTSLSYLLMKNIRLKKIILPINHLFNYNDKLFKKSYI